MSKMSSTSKDEFNFNAELNKKYGTFYTVFVLTFTKNDIVIKIENMNMPPRP